jgi:hypothetical protein
MTMKFLNIKILDYFSLAYSTQSNKFLSHIKNILELNL